MEKNEKKIFDFDVVTIQDNISPEITVDNRTKPDDGGGCGCGTIWLCGDFFCRD